MTRTTVAVLAALAGAAANSLNSNNDACVGWEVGYSTKGTTFYIKPGIGICPNPGDREWGIEFGLRVQF
jgi:hypothetical protein